MSGTGSSFLQSVQLDMIVKISVGLLSSIITGRQGFGWLGWFEAACPLFSVAKIWEVFLDLTDTSKENVIFAWVSCLRQGQDCPDGNLLGDQSLTQAHRNAVSD